METLVYHSGEILLSRRMSYAHLMKKSNKKELIKKMMKNQHDQIISELKGGKYLHLLSLETQEIEDKSLDEMVIDFLNTDED